MMCLGSIDMDDVSVFFRDRRWLDCPGSLDTDGICISKVPALDTYDIGCLVNVQG